MIFTHSFFENVYIMSLGICYLELLLHPTMHRRKISVGTSKYKTQNTLTSKVKLPPAIAVPCVTGTFPLLVRVTNKSNVISLYSPCALVQRPQKTGSRYDPPAGLDPNWT